MALKIPADVAREGRRFLREVDAWLTAEQWEMDAHELEVLAGCARAIDRLGAIRAALVGVATDDPVWTRLVTTERQLRTSLRIDLVQLGLPFGPVADTGEAITLNSRRAAKAGRTRWLIEAERQRQAGWAG